MELMSSVVEKSRVHLVVGETNPRGGITNEWQHDAKREIRSNRTMALLANDENNELDRELRLGIGIMCECVGVWQRLAQQRS